MVDTFLSLFFLFFPSLCPQLVNYLKEKKEKVKKLQTSATGDHLGRMFIKLHRFFSFVLCLNFCEPDYFFFLSHPFSPSNLRYFWTLGFLRYSVFLTMFNRTVLSGYITDLGKLGVFMLMMTYKFMFM